MLTTPLIRALALGGHEVDVIVRRPFASIFAHSPHVRQCFEVETIAPSFPQGWWRLAHWMRERHYDTIILAYAREKRLCFASLLSGAKHRIAMWSGAWGRLTLHRCLASHITTNPRPVSDILLSCSRALRVRDQGLKPDIFLTQAERESVRGMIPETCRNRLLVGIHPGSAGNACNLPPSIYGELAEQLLKTTEAALIITGTANERSLLQAWPNSVLTSPRVWLSHGLLDVRELASAIAEMDVLVCSSTGPLHLASAAQTPTVSPFCPAAPLSAAIWGNVGTPALVLEPLTCPIQEGREGRCDFRGEIPIHRVVEGVRRLLNETGATSELPGR